MDNMFYRAFEDRYRGSFELIKSRLEIYLPFILPLKKCSAKPHVLDLGCGRGEWLELLQQHGFEAKGIDSDEGMLQTCRMRDLNAIQGDAIAYLESVEKESLSIVSAFHLVEHIPFKNLQRLIREAHRALKPGGLLILETPNPENLLVGTSSFYLDPTHERPLPAELLSFVVEYAQFRRVKTLFLQEPNITATQKIGLQGVLEGVSPDYAVVSQKDAEPSMCALFDEPFNHEYGNRLRPLAQRYDQEYTQRITCLENKVEQLMQFYLRVYHSKPWRILRQLRKIMHIPQLIKCMMRRKNQEKPDNLNAGIRS